MNNNREKLIKFSDENLSWEDAIKLGVDLLVDNNISTRELANKIIESTNQYGPYYVVAEKVALAHTSVGEYNKKVGMSLVIFKNPIKFSDIERHNVNLLFTLSAIDAESHMDIMQKFANIFMNKNIVNEILNEKDIHKILNILEGVI